MYVHTYNEELGMYQICKQHQHIQRGLTLDQLSIAFAVPFQHCVNRDTVVDDLLDHLLDQPKVVEWDMRNLASIAKVDQFWREFVVSNKAEHGICSHTLSL